MESFAAPFSAVVLGAGGGIGAALVEALAADPACAAVLAVSRVRPAPRGPTIREVRADLTDEAALSAAAEAARALDELRLVIVAAGALHAEGRTPEKALRELSADGLAWAFAQNAIGPALALKHFAPLLPREGKAVIACLSARVGSIADNRKGGWYGYRAAKAALNQLVRTASVEIAARRRETIVVGLHPGTVDTGMSRPFLTGYAANEIFTPAFAAVRLLAVIDALQPADTGSVFAWDGAPIPP